MGRFTRTKPSDDLSLASSLTGMTLPPSREEEQVPVEILESHIGGVGTRVIESSPKIGGRSEMERQESAALREKAREVEALQDSSEFIANLNLDIRGEYRRPELSLAKEYRQKHHPEGVNGQPMGFWKMSTGAFINAWNLFCCCFCTTSKGDDDVIAFGPGVSTYFKLLKLFFFMYAVLTFLQLPAIIFNVNAGDYFSGVAVPLVSTTLGNLYRVPGENNTAFDEPYVFSFPIVCPQSEDLGEDGEPVQARCELDTGTLLFLYGCLDTLTVLVFLVFSCCTVRFAKQESKRFASHVLKVEQYSIQVEGIPATCSADDIRAHFEKLVAGRIHDVQLVQTTNNAISLCVKRGKLIKKLARADARRKFFEQQGASLTTQEKAEQAYDRLYEQVVEMDQKAADSATEGDAIFAFVTFASQRDRNKCVKIFSAFSCTLSQATWLRLDGKHVLKVSPAPPPSTLLWENNEVSSCSRLGRHLTTVLVMVLLLAVTTSINYVAEPFKLSKNLYETVSASGTVDTICDGLFADMDSLSEAVAFAQNNSDYRLKTRQEASLVDCLCENYLNPAGSKFPNSSDVDLFDDDGLCRSFLNNRVRDLGIQSGVSFGTLFMNTVIFLVLTESGFFMKYTSILKREMTIFKRLFVFTYINTGLLVLLVNADLSIVFNAFAPGSAEHLLYDESYPDFTHEWYRGVGTEILLVGFLNIFAPHIYPLILAILKALYRQLHNPISQSELNEMYLGPDFVLSYRYSQVLMMVFFIMTYSTGLPILYAFGLLSVSITYWVDKYFFTKVCRTPATFDSQMGVWTGKLMQYAALIHLAFGIWMLSSPFIFPASSAQSSLGVLESLTSAAGVNVEDIKSLNATFLGEDMLLDFGLQLQDRLSRDSSIPSLALFLLLVAYKILENFQSFVFFIDKLFKFFVGLFKRCCAKGYLASIVDAFRDDRQLTIQQALDLGELTGIPSYNILANPRYAHAFHLESQNSKRDHSLLEVLRTRATDSVSGITVHFGGTSTVSSQS